MVSIQYNGDHDHLQQMKDTSQSNQSSEYRKQLIQFNQNQLAMIVNHQDSQPKRPNCALANLKGGEQESRRAGEQESRRAGE